MGEGTEALLDTVDRFYEDPVGAAIEVPDSALAESVRLCLEVVVTMAEADPDGARAVLWRLQGDRRTLERLQELLGATPTRATLRLGAVIHLLRAELAQPDPNLRKLLPEILAWLDGGR